MNSNNIPKLLLLAVIAIGFTLSGCSTKKKGFVHRTFHNITSHYNGYFYARETIKEAEAKLDKNIRDDFNKILPIYKIGTKDDAKQILADMEKAFKKSSRVIQYHSINIRGKEYVDWIDEAYFIIGVTHFYKHDYFQAAEVFDYVAKTYKEQETRYLAMVWMVRSFNELTLMSRSQMLLDLMANDKEFPKQYQDELATVKADFFIRMESYDLAKAELRKAIILTPKKKARGRLTYILAQLEEKTGDTRQAAALFATVRKFSPPYEMAFQSRLKSAMLADAGSRSPRLKAQLLKMANDGKNKEFLDQIYYALGEMAMKDKSRREAEDYYGRSARASISNNYQKSLSYLRLADLYFTDKNYRKAQAYYDSTSVSLAEDFPDYDAILNKKNSLGELVKNIELIETQDSLMRIASMSEAERERFIEGLIEKRIEEEERKLEELERQQQQNLLAMNDPNSVGGNNTSGGAWYFYNPSQIGMGAAEFVRKWGDRKLADNWRRKNKQSLDFDFDNQFAGDSGVVAGPGNEPWRSTDYYLEGLPLTANAMQASRNMVLDAYYNTGNIYREQLNDYNEAIRSFEQMNTRYDTGRYYLPGLYQLYRLNLQVENQNRADYYKSLILQKHPETTYAKLVQNPDFLKQKEASLDKIEAFYGETYEAYLNRNWNQVLRNTLMADSTYAKTEFGPKFALLKAFARGGLEGSPAMIQSLEEVVANFPATQESVRAQELLGVLGVKPAVVKDSVQSPYSFTRDTTHFAIILTGPGADPQQLKTLISDFNKNLFGSLNYTVNSVVYNESSQMIVISGIKDRQNALGYFNALKSEDPVMSKAGTRPFVFVISADNYPIFYKEKKPDVYMKFFSTTYGVNP